MTIEEAINNRSVVEFEYDGHIRVVHPAAYGPHKTTGRWLLRGYQVDGTSKSRQVPLWDLFAGDKIVALRATGAHFQEDPPGYVRDDAHLVPVAHL